MFNGIYELAPFDTLRIYGVPVLDMVRGPSVVNLSVLGGVLVAVLRQDRVRAGLIALSVALLLLVMGVPFTAGVLGWCVVVFLATRVLRWWAARLGSAKYPILVGWVVIHVMYVPCMGLTLPQFEGHMAWGELTLMWGVAFLTLKSLHYVGQACRDRIDTAAAGSFARFLSYMVHVPSFRLGPYQSYEQFTDQVDTCKERMNWRNVGIGVFRISLGYAKYLILFYALMLPFMVPRGYTRPFMPEIFDALATESWLSIWSGACVCVAVVHLFLSGYSDGAIGMNRIMGITVPENYRRAYLATDIIDFWARWHGSVNTWLKEEVFDPLGGARKYWLAAVAVFAYCAFWHFATPLTVVMFCGVNMIAFYLTRKWRNMWARKRRAGDRLYVLARRWQLIDSIPSKIVGWVLVVHLQMVIALVMYDQEHGGLLLVARLINMFW